MAFLRAALRGGPHPAHELIMEGSLRGHDKAALRRARARLGIRARFWREVDRVRGDWLLPEHDDEPHMPNLPWMAARGTQVPAHGTSGLSPRKRPPRNGTSVLIGRGPAL